MFAVRIPADIAKIFSNQKLEGVILTKGETPIIFHFLNGHRTCNNPLFCIDVRNKMVQQKISLCGLTSMYICVIN